jgi:hypothetical protein
LRRPKHSIIEVVEPEEEKEEEAEEEEEVSYGAETWTITKREEQAVLGFERKIFRRIYGPKYGNGEWKTRTNRELEETSKGENIVKWIKGQRISWLGHL